MTAATPNPSILDMAGGVLLAASLLLLLLCIPGLVQVAIRRIGWWRIERQLRDRNAGASLPWRDDREGDRS